jgi:hypothetical protein
LSFKATRQDSKSMQPFECFSLGRARNRLQDAV